MPVIEDADVVKSHTIPVVVHIAAAKSYTEAATSYIVAVITRTYFRTYHDHLLKMANRFLSRVRFPVVFRKRSKKIEMSWKLD